MDTEVEKIEINNIDESQKEEVIKKAKKYPKRKKKLCPLNNNVKIIPFGGLGEIGKNITAFEYKDEIIVVDCGLAFPDEDLYGIDMVIPDVTYLIINKAKVKGLIITHGHEDHIGAIPYILKQINMPVYATKLTIGLIETKLIDHNILSD